MALTIKTLGTRLARPDVVFYALGWLMVVLVAGTVAQKYIGLYRAQEIFFAAPILWAGPVPLPGGATVMAVVFVSLLAKMLFASPWTLRNAGILMTHAGALLLLSGGLLTALGAREGSMVIYEGESADYVSAYHARELVVSEDGRADAPLLRTPWTAIQPGARFSPPGTPLTLEIVKACRNCAFTPHPADDPALADYRGRAHKFDIAPLPLGTEDETNRAGVQVRVRGADDPAEDGIYFSVDFIDVAPVVTAGGKRYAIALQKRRTYLPFSLRLVDFKKQLHPGTALPRSYRSDVVLTDRGTAWHSVVKMNAPLRYRGYTFYQSSFIETEDGRVATVFAVVRNIGRIFPYLASIVMCAGLLLHIALRLPGLLRGDKAARAVCAILLTGAVLTCAPAARATETLDMADFRRIPILDQGRVKPLDSFARTTLTLLSGRDRLGDMDAAAWLAETLFTPDAAYERPVFSIPDPRIAQAVGLAPRQDHLYAYSAVSEAMFAHKDAWENLLARPEENLTRPQRAMTDLYDKLRIFGELSRSLSLVFPAAIIPEGPLATAFGVEPGTALTYLDLRARQDVVKTLGEKALAAAEAAAGAEKSADDPDATTSLSPETAQVIGLIQTMAAFAGDRDSALFRVIPPQWAEKGTPARLWFSPWGIAAQGQGSPAARAFIGMWAQAVSAYRAQDPVRWAKSAAALRTESLRMAGAEAAGGKLALETDYNRAAPFTVAIALYMAALGALLAAEMLHGVVFYRLAAALAAGGLVAHAGGIAVRMVIMGRPPVTNLYASVLFVGAVTVLFALLYEVRTRSRLGLLLGATAGTALLFLAQRFNTDGDTMGMLTAVLDTNFWLATHVVMITVGYAACLLCGMMAHIYLGLRIVRPAERERAAALSRNMRGLSYVALFFAALGTILGGIWADQSWGRFWGWDPKENGAMLICLWLLFLTHGRLAGKMGETGFAAGLALTNAIVALAWFGVNLLGVGLHSYGFTSGAATGLAVFCVGELTFSLGAAILLRRRTREAGG